MNLSTDKRLHLLAGFAIAGAAHPLGLLVATVALLGIGLGKEVYDHFFGGTVDLYDALATVGGGAGMLAWIELTLACIQNSLWL